MSFDLAEFQKRVKNNLYPDGIDLETLIKDHSIDEKKLNEYISDFDEDDRDAMLYIVKSIKHVSWAEFKEKLLHLAIRIRTQIATDTYGFLLPTGTKYHSEEYFTSYVYENVFEGRNEPLFCGFDKITQNFIYVDDGSYSGTQLYKYLSGIFKQLISPFTDNTNDLQLYIPTADIVKDLKDNEYFVILETSSNRVVLYTKERKYYYNSMMYINVFNDLENFKVKHPDAVYLQIPDIQEIVYINKQFLEYALSEKKIYLCIPYMSKSAKDYIDKLNIRYRTIKIIYPDTIDYRIFNIIERSPFFLKEKVIHLFRLYSRLLPSIDYVFPIYFDHKMASIVSTLAVILGCGVVISTKKLMTNPNAAPKYKGPITKNCSINRGEIMDIYTFLINIYLKREPYDVKYNNVCSFCPKPIYALTPEDLKAHHK